MVAIGVGRLDHHNIHALGNDGIHKQRPARVADVAREENSAAGLAAGRPKNVRGVHERDAHTRREVERFWTSRTKRSNALSASTIP
jgi:hypothetical protein